MTERLTLSVPVADIPSETNPHKTYTLTMHGYVTCSCMSAANPVPGRQRYGQCKHTDQWEQGWLQRTNERAKILEELQALRERLREFDGGDEAAPDKIPVRYRLAR